MSAYPQQNTDPFARAVGSLSTGTAPTGSSPFDGLSQEFQHKFNRPLTVTGTDTAEHVRLHGAGRAWDLRAKDLGPDERQFVLMRAPQLGFNVSDYSQANPRTTSAGVRITGPHIHLDLDRQKSDPFANAVRSLGGAAQANVTGDPFANAIGSLSQIPKQPQEVFHPVSPTFPGGGYTTGQQPVRAAAKAPRPVAQRQPSQDQLLAQADVLQKFNLAKQEGRIEDARFLGQQLQKQGWEYGESGGWPYVKPPVSGPQMRQQIRQPQPDTGTIYGNVLKSLAGDVGGIMKPVGSTLAGVPKAVADIAEIAAPTVGMRLSPSARQAIEQNPVSQALTRTGQGIANVGEYAESTVPKNLPNELLQAGFETLPLLATPAGIPGLAAQTYVQRRGEGATPGQAGLAAGTTATGLGLGGKIAGKLGGTYLSRVFGYTLGPTAVNEIERAVQTGQLPDPKQAGIRAFKAAVLASGLSVGHGKAEAPEVAAERPQAQPEPPRGTVDAREAEAIRAEQARQAAVQPHEIVQGPEDFERRPPLPGEGTGQGGYGVPRIEPKGVSTKNLGIPTHYEAQRPAMGVEAQIAPENISATVAAHEQEHDGNISLSTARDTLGQFKDKADIMARGMALTPAADKLAKAAIEEKIKPDSGTNDIYIVAGGTGTGKTHFIESLDDTDRKDAAFYETHLEDPQYVADLAKRAADAGKNVYIVGTSRDPIESYKHVVKRAQETGKIVPTDYAARLTEGYTTNWPTVVDALKGDPRIEIGVVKNGELLDHDEPLPPVPKNLEGRFNKVLNNARLNADERQAFESQRGTPGTVSAEGGQVGPILRQGQEAQGALQARPEAAQKGPEGPGGLEPLSKFEPVGKYYYSEGGDLRQVTGYGKTSSGTDRLGFKSVKTGQTGEHGIVPRQNIQLFDSPAEAESELQRQDKVNAELGRRAYEGSAQAREGTIETEGRTIKEPQQLPARAGEAGFVTPGLANVMAGGIPRFLEKDVAPAIKEAATGLNKQWDSLRKVFAPQTRGPEAKFGAQSIRANFSAAQRVYDHMEATLGKARGAFDRAGAQPGLDFQDRMERGQPQNNPDLQPVADFMRQTLDDLRGEVQRAKPGALQNFITDYFPHFWKDPARAQQTFQNALFGKRPMQGPASFLKQRTIPTVADGIAMGLEPRSTNPVDNFLWKVQEMQRFIAAHDVMNEANANGTRQFVRGLGKAPDGWKFIDDRIGAVWGRNAAGETVMRGRYAFPEPLAQVLDNHLSPGLVNQPAFRAYRAGARLVSQSMLGLSTFHAMTSGFNSVISQAARGIEALSRGDIGTAAKSAVETPVAPFADLIKSSKLLKEWYDRGSTDPRTQAIVDAMQQGGARATRDNFYSTSYARNMAKALREGNLPGAMIRLPGAILETAAKPIMNHLVPRLKFAAAGDLIGDYLDKNPNATPDEVREAASKVWDSIDNRFGEMVHDNLMMNRVARDLIQASFLSAGWNMGTVREIGGAGVDVVKQAAKAATLGRYGTPELTHKMAYAMALPLITGMAGAAIQYLYTGKGPDELKDYFFPKTGSTDENGNPERITLPTYMRDLYGFKTQPGQTIAHKLNPMLKMAVDVLNNKDYYGTEIRHPDDPLIEQGKQIATHIGESALPLSVRNYMKEKERQTPIGQQIRAGMGFGPAPSYVNETPAETLARSYAEASRPQGSRTKEAADRAQLKSQLSRQLKLAQGDPEKLKAAQEANRKAFESGKLSDKDLVGIGERTTNTPLGAMFKHLTLEQGLNVWDKASPKEREQIRNDLVTKIGSVANLPPEKVKQLTPRIRALKLKQDEAAGVYGQQPAVNQ